ncbi:MAG: tRNA (adenosine(37)-N6)-threonylcarbamoyltransferase complex dimerization subunit type 1 TsaB, partial [Eubacterium sp.]|nr:tRNA (adenosine(37)-N6)-threonylcarbamoyltransferase complex dimerization subunit type 1 TsaB [Eubacterium sp.]
GLGMALNKPLISVPTLEGIAYHFTLSDKLICPMMDARRKQVYTAIYRFDGRQLSTVMEACACSVEELIGKVNELGREIIFLGDGVPMARDMMEEGLKVAHAYAPLHMNRQRAAAVGARAFDLYQEGKLQTAAEHTPIYLRKSQAERELEAKGKHLEEDSIQRAH